MKPEQCELVIERSSDGLIGSTMDDEELEALMRATFTEGFPSDVRRLVEAVQAAERDRLKEINTELLEALESFLEVHGVTQAYADTHEFIPKSWVELSDKARAAIAKATGSAA